MKYLQEIIIGMICKIERKVIRMSNKKFLLITISIIICGLLVLNNKPNDKVCYKEINYCYDSPKIRKLGKINNIREVYNMKPYLDLYNYEKRTKFRKYFNTEFERDKFEKWCRVCM